MSQTGLPQPGSSLGDFEIVEELGRGGMSVVYKARQQSLGRTIALKVLPPQFSYDEMYIGRFQREAHSAANLEHPHIVPIYDVGESRGLHYIAMRFIEGETLRDLMAREGAMHPGRVLVFIRPIASALDYAHQQGIIHRDVKPSNILIARDQTIYLADFGLARGVGGSSGLTSTGMIMGTPDYMSPEQARGDNDIGPPTDIYALGVIIYQMVTGSLPFEADSTMGMLYARLMQAPRPMRDFRQDLLLPVERVIMQALAFEPAQRYKRADELVQALQQVADLPSSAGQPTILAEPLPRDVPTSGQFGIPGPQAPPTMHPMGQAPSMPGPQAPTQAPSMPGPQAPTGQAWQPPTMGQAPSMPDPPAAPSQSWQPPGPQPAMGQAPRMSGGALPPQPGKRFSGPCMYIAVGVGGVVVGMILCVVLVVWIASVAAEDNDESSVEPPALVLAVNRASGFPGDQAAAGGGGPVVVPGPTTPHTAAGQMTPPHWVGI